MLTKPPKKLLPMLILDILRKDSDENHRLSQREIRDILKTEYDMTVDRKAIRRNIGALLEMGFPIEYAEVRRLVPNAETGEPEESVLLTDFYLERAFTDSELRLLIDSLLFSGHLPRKQCRELVDKLEALSSKYFRAHVKHICTVPETAPRNAQLFYTIESLDEAISAGKKVAFTYLEYGTDKRLHPKRRVDGTVREYVVSPYQMAAKEGKYYLICNYDKYDDISNYRVERIADIRMLDEPVKPFETLRGADRLRIAVAVRRAEQPAVGVEERHVHAPGIDADGTNGKAGFGRLFHALADLSEKRLQVPVQMAAVFDDPVREAVHLFELQSPPGQHAEHRPAAGRAEVECQKMMGFHGDAIRPGAAPCPSRAGNCRPR